MIHRLLAVCLLFSLTAGMDELQRSTTSARHRFCTCKDFAVRIEVMEFLAVPCDEICSDRSKEDTSRRNPLQLRRPRVRRHMNKKDYECLIKIKADPRLIVRNVNVTFREKGNNQSWYAVIQWTPLAFPKPWDGYCLNYFGSLGSSVKPKSSFFSKNTTRIKISPSWKEKEIHVVIFGLSTFGSDTDQLQTVLFRSPKVTSNTSMSNGLRHIRTRRGINTKEDECLAKIRTDPGLIVENINVTFHEEGKDSNKSWYAFVQWEPIGKEDFREPWDGYCLNYFGGDPGANLSPKTSFVLKNTTNRRITPSGKTKVIHIEIFGLSKFDNDTKLLMTRIFRPPPMNDVPPVPKKDKPVTLPPPTTDVPHVSTKDVPHVSTKGEPLKSPSPTTDPSNRVKFVFIVVGTMGGIALVVSFLWFFLRRKKSNPPLPHDFKYHAFIIYSREDEHWMKRTLLPLLEDKLHLTCCIHYKDFVPGKPIRDNMADSVYTSYKVIAIFSSNFVNSNYCKYELDVAVNRLVQKRDNSLAIIRIDGADCNELPSELRGRCFIDYYFRHERPFWKRRLLRFFDFPEESRRQSTAEDQGSDNNNDENRHDNRRVDFERLQSVQSNVSEISFL
ncbi:uncharacterized protein [Montipora foliosa]|uniref:uncharacterized protein isoform X3 n=1 Tax=Montipora foliosa TaxID=591990 RepID=UPI0035F1BF74